MTQPMVGVPRITGIRATKLEMSRITRGFLIFVIALNSAYLNLDNDIAQWSSVCIAQPHTGDFRAHEVSNWLYLAVNDCLCTSV